MKTAVPPRRSRVFALCGLSAAVHLLVLSLAARHGLGARTALTDAGAPLVVRLAPLPAAAVSASAAGAPSAAPASAGTPRRPRRAVAPAAAPALSAPAAPAMTAAPAGSTPAPPAPAAAPGPAPAARDEPGAEPTPFGLSPLRPSYRIAPPGAVRLVYRVGAAASPSPSPLPPPSPSSQEAYLEWRSDGSAYVLEMDGVLGRRSSSGIIGDDGIVAQHARTQQGERTLDTRFDALGQHVTLPDGAEVPVQPGTLDGAMLWVWLASVANASAGQLRDSIGVSVADADGVHPLRFDIVGEEEVDTGLGRIKAWHLAQYARPGEARVDAWLAPAQDWLPVQLRVTRPDGGVATQVLQRREAAGAL
jgi:hypothetical protein